jgi:hypothetical protein
MDIGMLWYDDDNRRSLSEKVARAVDFYKTKYGSPPTVCFINPATLKDKAAPETAGGIQLRSARNVLVDHFWLGVGETNANGNGSGKSQVAAKRARKAPRSAERSVRATSARAPRSVPA